MPSSEVCCFWVHSADIDEDGRMRVSMKSWDEPVQLTQRRVASVTASKDIIANGSYLVNVAPSKPNLEKAVAGLSIVDPDEPPTAKGQREPVRS
jgi:hypothetical protein